MKERTSPYIYIRDANGGVIGQVLITSSDKVVYNLMGDHYIQLDFVLDAAKNIPIGAYIEDEIFGKFYVTEEQMPTYDDKTGGYKYELKFNAWYKYWQIKQVCLTTSLTTGSAWYRKESNWTLTANLREHARAFMYNLMVLGYINTCDLSDDDILSNFIDIDTDNIDDAYNALTVSYSGAYCIDALKTLADTFDCEYWVDGTETDFYTGNGNAKIHFGKIENGDAITLALNDNVESMSISNDTSSKGDIIRAYGSTNNMPYTYRKIVYAQVHKVGNYYCIQTPNILRGDKGFLSPDWFANNYSGGSTTSTLLADGTYQASTVTSSSVNVNTSNIIGLAEYRNEIGRIILGSGDYNISIANTSQTALVSDLSLYNAMIDFLCVIDVRITMKIGTNETTLISFNVNKTFTIGDNIITTLQSVLASATQTLNGSITLSGGTYILCTYAHVSLVSYETSEAAEYYINRIKNTIVDHVDFAVTLPSELTYTYTGKEDGTVCYITYNDQTYIAILNPTEATDKYPKDKTNPYYQCLIQEPFSEVFEEDMTVEIDDSGTVDIPLAYYTQPYENPSSVLQIGETRLALPENTDPNDTSYWDDVENAKYVCINGAIVPFAYRNKVNAKNLRELAIAFDNIYPDGKLQVSAIYTTNEKDITDSGSESEKYRWDYLRYYLQVVLADASYASTPFVFDKDYILDGAELKLRFIVPNDLKDITTAEEIDTKNGCKLCGMQFATDFNKTYSSTIYDKDGNAVIGATQLYTIVRNEDYGCKLPNTTLYPTVGDPLVVENWNVKAMRYLGLIDNAEKRLMQKAFEYAHALQEGNFTFTCNMMSSFFFDLYGIYISLGDVDDENLVESGGAYLMVRNGFDVYAIPQLGQKVCINHDALSAPKETRIIGYEYKLDKPYDSPKLTCGETEAYSRLKQMEKEITKLS